MSLRLAVLRERANGETRIAATPETVRKFIALGAAVAVEAGAGQGASIADAEFTAAGAQVTPLDEVVRGAEIVLAVQALDPALLAGAAPGVWIAGAVRLTRGGEVVNERTSLRSSPERGGGRREAPDGGVSPYREGDTPPPPPSVAVPLPFQGRI